MSCESTPLPDRTEWRAQYVQMISFPTESQLTAEQNWWSQLTGSQPETSVRKPQSREDSGAFGDLALSLEIDPFRVKWTVAPRIDPQELPNEFPTLGAVFDRRDWLIEVMGRWLNQCPPINRLAFAGQLLQFVEDKEEAYRRLNVYLPGVAVDPNTSDFMYRVNRPRDSRTDIEGLRINRLCSWAAAKLTLGIQSRAQGIGEARLPIQEQDACVLNLDINTVPGFSRTELPHDDLLRIFTELVDVGLQAAEEGDR